MDKEREKIRSVASVLINARKHGWHFITLREFAHETELEKEEIIRIVDLFKKVGIFNYSFLSFDNPEMKKSIFEDRDDTQDPKGAISFAPSMTGKITEKTIRRFLEKVDFNKIEEIVNSDEALEGFLQKVKYALPYPTFDQVRRLILYKEKKIKITAGNRMAICEVIFSKPIGHVFEVSDIVLPDQDTSDEYQTLYNLIWQINKKFENETGVPNLIRQIGGKVWIEIDPLKI